MVLFFFFFLELVSAGHISTVPWLILKLRNCFGIQRTLHVLQILTQSDHLRYFFFREMCLNIQLYKCIHSSVQWNSYD